MARVELTRNALTLAGLTVTGNTTTGTTDDAQFTFSGHEIIYIGNTDATNARTLTLIGQANADGADFTDEAISVAAAGFRVIGGMELAAFRTGQKLQVDFDAGNEGDMEIYIMTFYPAVT
jgi:hypothetical protein